MNRILPVIIVFYCMFVCYHHAFISKIGFPRLLKASKLSMISDYSVSIPLGEGYKTVECKFLPLFEKSEFLVVTYQVPFSLNIEKPPKGFPAPIVNKDGKGGEKVT